MIGAGRAHNREAALDLGPDVFVDLEDDRQEDIGEVDVVLDVFGKEIGARSAGVVRAGGTLVTITALPEFEPRYGRSVFFVVEPDRARLAQLVGLVREDSLRVLIRSRDSPAEVLQAFNAGRQVGGRPIVMVDEP